MLGGVLIAAALEVVAGPVDVAKTEYDRYCREITGGEPPKATFTVDAKLDALHDEYRIVSEGEGVRFVGANERAVLFAVYDFLSRRGGCKWFWDGDIVPRKEKIDCAGLDVREKSQFEYRGLRYFAHRGLTRFQAEHWGLEDWKREIDWCVKNRLNLMMPRIGMDDTWQKAYPDIVPYPDPAKKLPEAGKGFDDRSLFWSLEYRGRLRKAFTAYAEERGVMMPVDFGTMTHWYSRTPRAYLDKVKPEFLPQATKGYGEDTGRVWDIRKPGYLDRYWRLTEAFLDAGYGKPDLLHTIGLGERMVYTNRADNLKLKIDVMNALIGKAGKEHSSSKVLLAGWDFYFTWRPDEVQSLLGHLDPAKIVIWDYEADAPERDWDWINGCAMSNNFTKWGLKGKMPYTFGIFLCYESGLDMRADYPLIEKRQKEIENDPMCKGYILWPESSHTDTFALRYFTENAWRADGKKTSEALLPAFCRDRYANLGDDTVSRFERIWRKVLPIAAATRWGNTYCRDLIGYKTKSVDPRTDVTLAEMRPALAAMKGVFDDLAKAVRRRSSEFARRDAIDLARAAADRLAIATRQELVEKYDAWCRGEASADEVKTLAGRYAKIARAIADLLELSTDFSLWESYERLDRIEKVRNPDFEHVLVDNAINGYCRSHQYEAARYWYQPLAEMLAATYVAQVQAEKRQPIDEKKLKELSDRLHRQMLTRPLKEMRPGFNRASSVCKPFAAIMKTLTATADL